MYRDHRKGPGGPPGGATYPGGPHGLKWGGEPSPPWAPMRLGLETLGWGRLHLPWGGTPPPLAGTPLGDPISRAGAPRGPI